MGWPKRNARVLPDVLAGVKTIKAIAADHGVSAGYVYAAIVDAGYTNQYLNQEEWSMILAIRKQQCADESRQVRQNAAAA